MKIGRRQLAFGFVALVTTIVVVASELAQRPVDTSALKPRPTTCERDDPSFGQTKRALSANPSNDAAKSIAAGDFRLRCSWDSHVPSSNEPNCGDVVCARGLYDWDNSKSSPIAGDTIHQRWSVCGGQFADAARAYARTYNRAIATHSDFPHKDICKVGGTSGHLNDYYALRDALGKRPPHEDAPKRVGDIATAARFGLIGEVRRLLAEKHEADALDRFGLDGLQWAAARGHEEIVDALLAAPRTVRSSDNRQERLRNYGFEPEMLAAAYGHVGILEKLQRQRRSEVSSTELMAAAVQRGHVTVMKYLLGDRRLDDWVNLELNQPQRAAALIERLAILAVVGGHAAATELLLDRGLFVDLSVSATFYEGKHRPLLLHALTSSSRLGGQPGEVVRLLLKRGAGHSADTLLTAVASGNADVIEAVLDFGLNPNALGRNAVIGIWAAARPAVAPLVQAASSCWPGAGIVALLIRRGAAPNQVDADGKTALIHAANGEMIRTPRGITGMSAKVRPNAHDAVPRNLECIKELLDGGADPRHQDNDGNTALHMVAKSDYQVPTIKLLLSSGADPSAVNKTGKSPLDIARELGLDLVPALLVKLDAKPR